MNDEWLQATTAGSLERIRALLEEGIEINSKDKYGQTAVMNASRNGNVEVVRLLIEKGADLDVTAKYNLSALMLAVINGHREIVQLLTDAGADTRIRGTGAPGFANKTALTLARDAGRVLIVERLQAAGAEE